MANRLRGARRKITPHIARKIFLLAGYGLTDLQIAQIFDLNKDTITEFKKEAEYSVTIRRCKDEADLKVINALYHRAIGYSHPEDKIFQFEGQPVIVPTIKHYPPDTDACKIWLYNRRRSEWKDKVENESDQAAVRNSVTQIFCNVTKKQQLQISRGSDPMDTLFGDSNKDEWNRDNRPAPAID